MPIPLITPKTVKESVSNGEAEKTVRLRDMALEEERLVRSINDLRETEAFEKKRVKASVESYRAEAKAEVSRLTGEVTGLENRRAAAMAPIEEIRNEATKKNADAGELQEKVNKMAALLDIRERDVRERESQFLADSSDKKQVLDEREQSLDRREERTRAEEIRSKNSLDSLNERWTSFHAAVHAKDAELAKREAEVSAGAEANMIRAREIERSAQDYKTKDRELADRSATLERASAEIAEMRRAAGLS